MKKAIASKVSRSRILIVSVMSNIVNICQVESQQFINYFPPFAMALPTTSPTSTACCPPAFHKQPLKKGEGPVLLAELIQSIDIHLGVVCTHCCCFLF